MLVGDLGEEALVKELRGLFAAAQPDVPTGIGDDAAVINFPPGTQGVWTTDLLLEGVHFERDWQTPRQLGRKCLAVNLSDLASMGATPRFALFSIGCAPETRLDYFLELCRGFAALASRENVAVIGGNTTGSTCGINVSVTAGGYVPRGGAILRSGAQAGDAILVTGYLGSAAAGLRLLKQDVAGRYPELIQAFLEPEARLIAGKAAFEAGATAMTDVSDGLASDLRHICEESRVGAMVDPGLFPVSARLKDAAAKFGWDVEDMVLTGGEDYELLFTLPGEIAGQVKSVISHAASLPVTIIGEIMPVDYGIRLLEAAGGNRPMPAHGFDHFQKDA